MADAPVAHLNLKPVAPSDLNPDGEDWLVVTLESGASYKMQIKDLEGRSGGGVGALESSPLDIVDGFFSVDASAVPDGRRYLIGVAGEVDGVYYHTGDMLEVDSGAFVRVASVGMRQAGVNGYKQTLGEYTLLDEDLGWLVQPANQIDQIVNVNSVSKNGIVTIVAPDDNKVVVKNINGMFDQNGNILSQYVLPARGVLLVVFSNADCRLVNAQPSKLNLQEVKLPIQGVVSNQKVLNHGQNSDIFASANNPVRPISLSLLTDRSISGGSKGAVSQKGLKLNNGTVAGSMAMVSYDGILGYGGQNGNNYLNFENYPFTLFFSTNYQPNGGTRMRVLIGQTNADIGTPLPDDGTKSGIIVEIESQSASPFFTRIRLGVAKGGVMYWSDWHYGGNDDPATDPKGLAYKTYPCSYALFINGGTVRLTCTAHKSSEEGFVINHSESPPQIADAFLGQNTANLQITNEKHNASSNVPLFLEHLQYQNHAF